MQLKSYLHSKLPFFVAISLPFMFASCGSYQYAGYDNDGIYGTSEVIINEEQQTEEAAPNPDNGYYKNYFAEKSQKYEKIAEAGEDVIFTDIDAYEGNYDNDNEDISYENGYAGWGQDNDDVTINIYSNYGWNNYGYSWYRPYYNGWYTGFGFYGYSPFFYGSFYNYGYPYYGIGYYHPYGYGHGYGHYNHGGYYGNHYYRPNISYNAGRRGSNVNHSYRNSTVNSRSRISNSNTRVRTNTFRRTRDANDTNTVRTTRSNNSNTRVNKPRRSSTSSNSTYTPRRSSSSSSSSSTRSSSGGSRSSGGSTSRRGGGY